MKKTLPVHNKMLSEKLEAESERIQQEQLRKRYAYEAICALVDPVSESELQRYLSVLDPNAWCEVVEERFLARLCGFPLCDAALNVDFHKKHTIMRRKNESTGKEQKMIVPTESELVKFCSDRCMGKSRAIASQLAEQRKQFIIPNEKSQWMAFLTGEEPSEEKRPRFGVELVTKLHDLKLADAEPNDENESREEGLSEDSEAEERNFLQQIKTFVTNKESTGIATVTAEADPSERKEWKRGFLLVPPSSVKEMGTESTAFLPNESESWDGVKKRNGRAGKGNTLLGEVIERKTAQTNAKGLTKKAGRDEKKPKIVEAPRISAEQVKQTL